MAIAKSARIADWIYHDVRLDCDNGAGARTHERFVAIDEAFGWEALFGMAGWWTVSSYYKLKERFEEKGSDRPPDLTPNNIESILNSDESPERKRAAITARQFISALTHSDLEMALAIFNAAYESEDEDAWGLLLWHVLILSIRIVSLAEEID